MSRFERYVTAIDGKVKTFSFMTEEWFLVYIEGHATLQI